MNSGMGNVRRLFQWLVTGVCLYGSGSVLVDMLKEEERSG